MTREGIAASYSAKERGTVQFTSRARQSRITCRYSRNTSRRTASGTPATGRGGPAGFSLGSGRQRRSSGCSRWIKRLQLPCRKP
jgi:hypothetical protein